MIYAVTISGADNSVQPKTLARFQKKYPFTEWGILLSKSRWAEGTPRYPSIEWLRGLKPFVNDLRLSGHVCGSLIRDLLDGTDIFETTALKEFVSFFDRFQLNFHGIDTSGKGDLLAGVLKKYPHKEFIVQYNEFSQSLPETCLSAGVSVSALFDVSGGNGRSPEQWKKPLNGFNCGYAGGLGPENLFDQIKNIEQVTERTSYWIDMESKVRSNNDELFDLQKVSKCLRIASDFITTTPHVPNSTWLRYPKSLKELGLILNNQKNEFSPFLFASYIDAWKMREQKVAIDDLYCKCSVPTGDYNYICDTCGGTNSRTIAEGL